MTQPDCQAHTVPAAAGSVAASTVEQRLGFLQRVYGSLTVALVVTALGGAIAINTGVTMWLLHGDLVLSFLVIFAWMGLAYVTRSVRHKPGVNILAYAAYALFTGLVISNILLLAMFLARALGHGSMFYILQALAMMVAVFAGLTSWAMVTKRDFSFRRAFLVASLIALIAAVILHYSMRSSILGTFTILYGVLLLSVRVLCDTEKILKSYANHEHVAASLELFVDTVGCDHLLPHDRCP